MQLNRAITLGLTLMVLMLVGGEVKSQNLGTYSPYSMYGVGDLNTPGTLTTRSMGGAGAALRSTASLNLLNPASQGTNTTRQSVLFNFGADVGAYYLSQNSGGEDYKTSAYNSYNIRDIAVQIPLYKGLGMAISVTPYSSVGYVITNSQQVVDVGQINYVYSGSGGLNEGRVAIGYAPHNKFSMGVAARYLWGVIQRTFSAYPDVITGNGSYSSTLGSAIYSTSKMMVQFGLLYSPIISKDEALSFGVTYDLGGDLSPDVEKYIYGSGTYVNTIAESFTYDGVMVLPGELTVGGSYQNTKWTFLADYTFKNWGNMDSESVSTLDGVSVDYRNTSTYKFGVEYIPSRNDVRSYAKRVAYRAGARYGDYYQTYNGYNISEYAITSGVSLPLKFGNLSRVELGFEWGGVGSTDVITSHNDITGEVKTGLVKQRYVKFSLGLMLFGDDYWFQRVKYD